MNQRHLPFMSGIFLLVLIFLVDRYRQNGRRPQANGREANSENDRKLSRTGFASRFSRAFEERTCTAFVFSGLLLAALPLWNATLFIGVAVVLF